jgi:hypothetical protein
MVKRIKVKNEINFINKGNWLLVIIGGGIFALSLWMTVEALITFFNSARKPEPQQTL